MILLLKMNHFYSNGGGNSLIKVMHYGSVLFVQITIVRRELWMWCQLWTDLEAFRDK